MKGKNISWIVYILLAFGILISGPRFSGAFAAAIGRDLFSGPAGGFWVTVETFSGWALALFEALAFAFIASRFRKIQILDDDTTLPLAKRILPANFVYWLMLLVGQVFLLLTIPTISTVHQATQVFRVNGVSRSVPEILTWSNLFQNHLTWLWLFITSAASTLFVFLIGLVMDDFGVLAKKLFENEDRIYEAFDRLNKNLPIVDPQSLSKEAGITLKQSADFLDAIASKGVRTTVQLNQRLADIKRRTNNGTE